MGEPIIWIEINTDDTVTKKTVTGPLQLEDIQAVVGDPIDMAPGILDGQSGDLYINDNALMLGMDPNDIATRIYWNARPDLEQDGYGPAIYGNAVLVINDMESL